MPPPPPNNFDLICEYFVKVGFIVHQCFAPLGSAYAKNEGK